MANLESRQARVGRPAPALTFAAADMGWQDEVVPAICAGRWTRALLIVRLRATRGRTNPWPWVEALTDYLLTRYLTPPTPAELLVALTHFSDPADWEWSALHPPRNELGALTPARVLPHLPMSQLLTRLDLRRVLDLTDSELDWFADSQDRLRREGRSPLVHYRYRVLDNGRKARLLEIPKPRLKEIQRRLVRHCVARLPLHPAAHGSVVGRSVFSCVAEHSAAAVVVRCDLESFFASITADRVRGLIASTGADSETARLIAGLCTATVPVSVRAQLPRPVTAPSLSVGFGPIAAHRRWTASLAEPHLPQGAPSSPSVANAIAFSLDHRLSRLADSVGAHYTRYVDDLIFSGPSGVPVGALLAGIRAIVTDAGFRMSERKTAVLRSSRRQQVLGAVLNERPAIARTEVDRLRAILHNCRTRGVASQAGDRTPTEFRGHLQGKIAWVNSIDSRRGERLAAMFATVDWSS